MTKPKYDVLKHPVVPQYIIIAAVCVFAFCSAIVINVEMPLLN